jgi:hypothetical protein
MKIENQEVHEPSQVKSYCSVVHRARKPQSASPLRGLGVGKSEQAQCSSRYSSFLKRILPFRGLRKKEKHSPMGKLISQLPAQLVST